VTVLAAQLRWEANQLRRMPLWRIQQRDLEIVAARLDVLASCVADLEIAIDGGGAPHVDRPESDRPDDPDRDRPDRDRGA
jgi:hypothetical protein